MSAIVILAPNVETVRQCCSLFGRDQQFSMQGSQNPADLKSISLFNVQLLVFQIPGDTRNYHNSLG